MVLCLKSEGILGLSRPGLTASLIVRPYLQLPDICKHAQELREAKDAAEKLRLQMVDLKTRLGADPASAGTGGAGGASPDDGRHTPLRPSKERDALNPELAAFLRKVTLYPHDVFRTHP